MRRIILIAALIIVASLPQVANADFSVVIHYSTSPGYVPYYPYVYSDYDYFWDYYDGCVFDVIIDPFPWFVEHWVHVYYSPCGYYRYYYYDHPCASCRRVYVAGRWRYRYPVRLRERYVYHRDYYPDRDVIRYERYVERGRTLPGDRTVVYRDGRRRSEDTPDYRSKYGYTSSSRPEPEPGYTSRTRTESPGRPNSRTRNTSSQDLQNTSPEIPAPLSSPSSERADGSYGASLNKTSHRTEVSDKSYSPEAVVRDTKPEKVTRENDTSDKGYSDVSETVSRKSGRENSRTSESSSAVKTIEKEDTRRTESRSYDSPEESDSRSLPRRGYSHDDDDVGYSPNRSIERLDDRGRTSSSSRYDYYGKRISKDSDDEEKSTKISSSSKSSKSSKKSVFSSSKKKDDDSDSKKSKYSPRSRSKRSSSSSRRKSSSRSRSSGRSSRSRSSGRSPRSRSR